MTWEELFRKWWGRLNEDGGWTVEIVPNQFLDAIARAEVCYPHRAVTFQYCGSSAPANFWACHEVVHVLVMRLWSPAYDAVQRLGDPGEAIRGHLRDEMEGMVDALARAFLRAYGEAGHDHE